MSAVPDLLALAARAQQMRAACNASQGEAVLSPCISVCRMTADRSHCVGCFRSLDEIREWSRAEDPRRLAIWRNLLSRAGLPEEAPQEHLP